MTLPDALQRVVALLPAAWRYSDVAQAHVVFDALEFSHGPHPGADCARATAPIIVQGKRRGEVWVGYPCNTISKQSAPFLKEEQRLLTEAARQIALFVERLNSKQEQETLREQLSHAERLITVGQLAAIALNPLTKDCMELP